MKQKQRASDLAAAEIAMKRAVYKACERAKCIGAVLLFRKMVGL